ncbi:MAG: protein kinase [Holophaga sp.]|nr:protein kinase [Holophaga sp.]
MSRPLLLILDGPSPKSAGIEEALVQSGWDVALTSSGEATAFLKLTETALVMLDPNLSGESGLDAVRSMRAQDLNVPIVVLKRPDGAMPSGKGFSVPIPGVAGNLDGSLPVTEWPAILDGILATKQREKHKFTAEELFADILADIDAPKPAKIPIANTQPFLPRVPVSAPPKPLVLAKPVSLPTPVPEAAVAMPIPAPVPLRMPLPSARPIASMPSVVPAKPSAAPAKPLPDLSWGILEPLPAAAAPKKSDFTLSGISGVDDPFGNELNAPGVLDSVGSIEFMETGGSAPRPSQESTPQPVAPLPPPSPAPLSFPAVQAELDEKAGVLEELGNYYLLEKIAVGGMAELFKARQRGVHNFEKIVAIKRILPHLSDNDEFVRMFIDEAKLAAQLTHPNIVQIFDLGKAGGFYYIAMEYVDGKDLRSLLRKVREYKMPLPEPVAAFVTMKVAGALDYAHRKKGMNDKELKLVHRDISPQNVLISSDGSVKLVDFGIAKAATKTTQTVAGALKGKLLYMSPEQALGQPLDSRSDIYSLGLVLFELLTGERCFQADSELGVLEKVRLGKIQDVRSVNPLVSREMASILERALQKNVEQRYPSARILERDLKALLSRSGNEPVEHDIAEYGNILLKGTLEQVEAFVSSRFPLQHRNSDFRSGEGVPALRHPDPPTRVDVPSVPPQLLPAPPENLGLDANGSRSWMLPAAALVLAGIAIVLWLVVR